MTAPPLGGQKSAGPADRWLIFSLALVTLAVTVLAVAGGEYELSPMQVVQVLLGGGEGLDATVVWQWRMPRAVAALVFGAALALSGAVFQLLTRNPLGSPDVIGFSTGSYTGALLALTFFSGGFVAVSLGSLVGGLATALGVYALAWRRGTHGFRLILVGIGVSAALAAVNQYLILMAELDVAMAAAVWGAGTLNGLTWPMVIPMLWVVIIAGLALILLGPRLHMLQLGEDLPRALGMRVETTKLAAVILAIMLTSAVTTVAGPIAFVALVAPQIARKLFHGSGLRLASTALIGALLLATSDLLAQRLFAPIQLPVGVLTVCVGGVYLIYLLNHEARRSTA